MMKSYFDFNSIRVKLILFCVLLVVLIAFVLGLTMVSATKREHIKEQKNVVVSLATDLAKRSTQPLLSRDFSQLKDLVNSFADLSYFGEEHISTIMVIDANGKLLAQRNVEAPDKQYHDILIKKAVEIEHSHILLVPEGKYEVIVPVKKEGRRLGTAIMGYKLGHEAKLIAHVWKAFFIVLIIVIVIAILGCFGFANTIIDPIQKLVDAMARVSRGELGLKIPMESKDEMGQLASSFNKMALNLRDTTVSRDLLLKEIAERKLAEKELRKARDELEQQVEERTAELSRSNEQLKLEIEDRKQAQKEKEKLEAQFQQAQRLEAVGTLAGGIAHDFNNLLMGIQGNISLILMDIDPTHPYYKRLENIEKQIQSGAKLTSHLLGYARKGKYEIKLVDLNHLVKEASGTLGRTRKEVTVHQELAEDLFAIEADQGQIEQVLLNLFVNAADAMPDGGDLILKTMNVTHNDMKGKLYNPKSGDYVLLLVTDTGIGMDKKTMDHIFEPFFTTKEMGRGTGLGLASAYGIIKGHGGYIDVYSNIRQGATFNIYLPASQKQVHEAVKTTESFIKGTGTVLFVDDEELILEVGKELLEAMGYRVLIAKDGKEAIDVYKKNRDEIDIVILDMVMPNMGGGKAYDRMKEINPDIKVLLSSGFSIDSEATEILKRGCNGFIQKPFSIKNLSQKIRKIIE